MVQAKIPAIFEQLLTERHIESKHILTTADGFFLVYKSVSDLLTGKGIQDFLDSQGERLQCSSFFDDWYLYAVPSENGHAYSLLKLREQEQDAKDGSPADGDTPGVTISFVAFDCNVLLRCLADPVDENRKKLNGEINRVVVHRGQNHHPALKKYFQNPKSQGAYLVADTYTKYIATYAENGVLPVPDAYRQIVQRNVSYKNSKKWARLPGFIKELNEKAGYAVCDNENIYIQNPDTITEYEAAAILATHAGNTSVYSFAAEVEYHAKFLTKLAKVKIPFFGRSIYDSAIRADMTVDDTEFEGPAPFYQANSKIVKRQYVLHQR